MSADLTPQAAADVAVDLTHAQARLLTDRIRGVAAELVDLVRAAYFGRAWLALGYPSWRAYLEAEIGTALRGLSIDDRQETIGILADSGLSQRAIGAAVGRSPERVRAELKLVRPDGAGPTLGQDGRVYAEQRQAPTARPARRVIKTLTVLELLAAAGADGMTIPELMKRKRWSYGIASATLSRLHAQVDHCGARRIERLDVWREGYSSYVHPDHIGGRPTLAPGQRRSYR